MTYAKLICKYFNASIRLKNRVAIVLLDAWADFQTIGNLERKPMGDNSNENNWRITGSEMVK